MELHPTVLVVGRDISEEGRPSASRVQTLQFAMLAVKPQTATSSAVAMTANDALVSVDAQAMRPSSGSGLRGERIGPAGQRKSASTPRPGPCDRSQQGGQPTEREKRST
jgi:hypothetical protein